MRKLLMIVGLAVGLTSCSDNVVTEAKELNLSTGRYSVDLMSVQVSGSLGGVDASETFENLALIHFDYGQMWTLNNDEEVQAIPILGFNFENNYFFLVERNGTELMIGGETWYIVESNADNNIQGDINLTRVTDYGGMGMDIQTMVLTEL